MVIIGIILTFVVMAFGDFGNERRVYMMQQHLRDLIKLARVKAIIESKTYGIHINKSNYQFSEFNHAPNSPYGHWQVLTDPTFRARQWPGQAQMKYTHPHTDSTPEIIISADGNITPFSLVFTTPNHDTVSLDVKFNGQIKLHEKLANS